VSNFTYNLTRLHRRLDDDIRAEAKHRIPDAFRLLRLKKLRLLVKDRLHARMLKARTA
jgi:hypothetical protein